MNIYARQGDLVFEQTTITGDLTAANSAVLAGHDSAAHTVKGAMSLRTEGLVTFLRAAKKVTVTHAGRHLPITLEPGDYRVFPLRERGDGTDRAVED